MHPDFMRWEDDGGSVEKPKPSHDPRMDLMLGDMVLEKPASRNPFLSTLREDKIVFRKAGKGDMI